jgi:hypothetical protein
VLDRACAGGYAAAIADEGNRLVAQRERCGCTRR